MRGRAEHREITLWLLEDSPEQRITRDYEISLKMFVVSDSDSGEWLSLHCSIICPSVRHQFDIKLGTWRTLAPSSPLLSSPHIKTWKKSNPSVSPLTQGTIGPDWGHMSPCHSHSYRQAINQTRLRVRPQNQTRPEGIILSLTPNETNPINFPHHVPLSILDDFCQNTLFPFQ